MSSCSVIDRDWPRAKANVISIPCFSFADRISKWLLLSDKNELFFLSSYVNWGKAFLLTSRATINSGAELSFHCSLLSLTMKSTSFFSISRLTFCAFQQRIHFSDKMETVMWGSFLFFVLGFFFVHHTFTLKQNLQLPNLRGHACPSMGKSTSFMGHSALIVNLLTITQKTVKNWQETHTVSAIIKHMSPG